MLKQNARYSDIKAYWFYSVNTNDFRNWWKNFNKYKDEYRYNCSISIYWWNIEVEKFNCVFTYRNCNYVCLWNIFAIDFVDCLCDTYPRFPQTRVLYLSPSEFLSPLFLSLRLLFLWTFFINMTVMLRLRNPTEMSLLTSTKNV